MSFKRRRINILLLILNLILGILAVGISRRPSSSSPSGSVNMAASLSTDMAQTPMTEMRIQERPETIRIQQPAGNIVAPTPTTSHFRDINTTTLTSPSNPLHAEAAKVLSGRLEETDSLNRRRILSYCEHLRAAYPTHDIDFIRQVFSNDALIIVGHVVKTARSNSSLGTASGKVKYSLRTKQQYLEQLSKIFDSGKKIDIKFSDFKIMRHPTMDGIYGVTLRQRYSCGSYADDGYLFLMWDFRNRSMPLIHVRTWQPTAALSNVDDELIGIGDFNLE